MGPDICFINFGRYFVLADQFLPKPKILCTCKQFAGCIRSIWRLQLVVRLPGGRAMPGVPNFPAGATIPAPASVLAVHQSKSLSAVLLESAQNTVILSSPTDLLELGLVLWGNSKEKSLRHLSWPFHQFLK